MQYIISVCTVYRIYSTLTLSHFCMHSVITHRLVFYFLLCSFMLFQCSLQYLMYIYIYRLMTSRVGACPKSRCCKEYTGAAYIISCIHQYGDKYNIYNCTWMQISQPITLSFILRQLHWSKMFPNSIDFHDLPYLFITLLVKMPLILRFGYAFNEPLVNEICILSTNVKYIICFIIIELYVHFINIYYVKKMISMATSIG